jgi:acetyl-CoA carboxylase alpha subunit
MAIMATHSEFERSIQETLSKIEDLKELANSRGLDVEADLKKLEAQLDELRTETFKSLSPMRSSRSRPWSGSRSHGTRSARTLPT